MRIDKLLEKEGFGSRKTVKRLFQKKLVKVDGQVVVEGSSNVDSSTHHITVMDQIVNGADHVYYLMNKPKGTVTARTDAKKKTVMDLIQNQDQTPNLYPVGRLDRDTEGLLLITDNGPLGYQLLLPDKQVSKTYEAIINEQVTQADVEHFKKGIVFIGGVVCKPAQLIILSASETESQVQLTIQEGKFHQVKKMFLAVGKKVIYLKRITMGPLHLEETLAPGEYRELNREELERLKEYFR
ncbi:16S rRNA pseudouridine(516) synthase [Jeotgalibaca sp. MA1X17-3]|uniref:pseudouridine synthase n=1 Tax=Jeotgalibaca sp. MA1X17-3 TaxID=2908211 RepID=UPI001F2C38B8|nr:16S rRNA pseudouridine(516) synthase [Jeotgalibaca sp. MA1X17-3]UJF16645.1 16S rRNA pseudouridine(516) synthase [Jeotgalibaca sp. MA1X17-3]